MIPISWARHAFGPALLSVACGPTIAQAQEPAPAVARHMDASRRDFHSFADPDVARVRHLALDLAVDFDRRELAGTATLTVDRPSKVDGPATLTLDSRDLSIESAVALGADGAERPTTFEVGPADPILGRPIRVALPGGATRVRLRYRTSPNATALQWVAPAQTAGGRLPYLFTQSQAIHARSWIPIQDSPGIRISYEATIRLPGDEFSALMAADRVGEDGRARRFAIKEPIPAYLIALAVGDLKSEAIGPRSRVWAEPGVVSAAAAEFADTDAMIRTVEARFGPYRWGSYDLLVLPPSFPFGGMENPKLTFATPTVLVGDRSLVGLIAHELAHSWSGNLVTNATWRDFWLNEGFTTYLERRVVEDVFGVDRAAMEWVLARRELRDEMTRMAPRDQVLHVDLRGRDPDDAMNAVAYEKGALLLATLERVAGRDRFDAFLKGYFDHFAFRSITTAEFEAYLRAHLFAGEAVEPISLHAWLHEPGLPPDAPEFRSAKFDAVDALATGWLAGSTKAADLPSGTWSTFETLRFLDRLPPRLDPARMADLDGSLHLTGSRNSEIAQPWLLLAIRSGYHAADARLADFLATIGRRKYVLPLYKELARTPGGRDLARAIFARAEPRYHPITAESVREALAAP